MSYLFWMVLLSNICLFISVERNRLAQTRVCESFKVINQIWCCSHIKLPLTTLVMTFLPSHRVIYLYTFICIHRASQCFAYLQTKFPANVYTIFKVKVKDLAWTYQFFHWYCCCKSKDTFDCYWSWGWIA